MSLITITHSMGSQGMDIARQVAEALNLELYDDQRLKEQALKMGIRAEDLKGLDEKKPGFFDRLLSSKPEAYQDLIESVVYQVSRGGDGVIVGHGSQILLKAFDCALHVLVHASESYRIRNIMKHQKLDPESAQKLIHKGDRDKMGYFRFTYNLNWDDPSIYDLAVNPEKMGMDVAVKIITAVAQSNEINSCSLTVLETVEKLSQQRLALASLAKHNMNLIQLTVEIPEKGVALLRGFTYSEEDKQLAIKLVKAVPGISDVRATISVIQAGGY